MENTHTLALSDRQFKFVIDGLVALAGSLYRISMIYRENGNKEAQQDVLQEMREVRTFIEELRAK